MAMPSAGATFAALRGMLRAIVRSCWVAMVAGCATVAPPPHPLDKAEAAYALAVIPVSYQPGSDFGGRTYDEMRALGAVKGAGVGALAGGLLVGLGAIVFPPLGVPLGLALTPYFTAGGAIAGYAGSAAQRPDAPTEVPPEQGPILERTLNDVLSNLPLPELTSRMVVRNVATFTPLRAEVTEGISPTFREGLPDYRALRDRGFGGAIEIRITRVGFAGWGGDGISLFVTAEARLIDLAADSSAWVRGLVYESATHSFSLWMREDADLTRVELERAARTLAERVVDVFVLSTEPSGSHGSESPDTCGVTLIDPEPALEIGPRNRQRLVAPRVSSLTPVLAWSARPVVTGTSGPDPWGMAKDRRYDLRIWKALEDAPGDIAYERLGLTATQHAVEVALEPAATYFWSVRMRGTVDGHSRAAPWSLSKAPPVFSKPFLRQARFDAFVTGGNVKLQACRLDASIPCGCLDYLPAENSYRFRTP